MCIKKPAKGGFLCKSLAVPYFHMATATLSSALSGFTSEVGMGSGGTRSLLPPGKSASEKYLCNNLESCTCYSYSLLFTHNAHKVDKFH